MKPMLNWLSLYISILIDVHHLAGLGTIEFSVHYEKQHSQLQVTVQCAKVSFKLN